MHREAPTGNHFISRCYHTNRISPDKRFNVCQQVVRSPFDTDRTPICSPAAGRLRSSEECGRGDVVVGGIVGVVANVETPFRVSKSSKSSTVRNA